MKEKKTARHRRDRDGHRARPWSCRFAGTTPSRRPELLPLSGDPGPGSPRAPRRCCSSAERTGRRSPTAARPPTRRSRAAAASAFRASRAPGTAPLLSRLSAPASWWRLGAARRGDVTAPALCRRTNSDERTPPRQSGRAQPCMLTVEGGVGPDGGCRAARGSRTAPNTRRRPPSSPIAAVDEASVAGDSGSSSVVPHTGLDRLTVRRCQSSI